ncbi:MAG TPA: SIMPL domain-containing protein [Bacteroidia bacterium]|nr:SIMPL domain-containing protein [Bacteroidia bacterium]
MQKFHKTIFTFLFSIIASSIMSQTIDLQQIKQTKKISVTGSSEMEVEPDQIFITIDLREYYNKDKKKIDIERIKKEFIEACKNAAVPDSDIRLQNVNGYNVASIWERKKRKDPDFFATVSYIIKLKSTQTMDQLIARLNDEATVGLNVTKLSNSKEAEYRKTVKEDALKNAKEKARYLCESIGERLGGAIFIEEINNDNYYQPMMGKAMMMSNAAMDGGGNIETTSTDFQKIKIRFEIRAEFEIK